MTLVKLHMHWLEKLHSAKSDLMFFFLFKKNAFLNDLTDDTKSLLHYFSPRCYLRNTHFGIAQLEAFYLDALKALGKCAIC